MQREIQNIIDNYSVVPWFVLDKIFQKLDNEEIKELTALLEEMHDSYDYGYNAGYDEGYDVGYSQGNIDGTDR